MHLVQKKKKANIANFVHYGKTRLALPSVVIKYHAKNTKKDVSILLVFYQGS